MIKLIFNVHEDYIEIAKVSKIFNAVKIKKIVNFTPSSDIQNNNTQLKQIFKKYKITSKKVDVVLSIDSIVTRQIEVPAMNEKDKSSITIIDKGKIFIYSILALDLNDFDGYNELLDNFTYFLNFYSTRNFGNKVDNIYIVGVGYVVTEGVTTENTTDDISKAEATTSLLKLTIDLKVSGDKDKVEKYIRSLNTLTSRKINVKSIKLAATVAETITGEATNELTNEVTADIIFNQYIFTNGEEIIRLSNYSFYDENTGFSNFADMFK